MEKPHTGQLTVEKLKAEQIDTACRLINDVHGELYPFTQKNEDALRQATVFGGFIDGQLISVADGFMRASEQGSIRWACVDRSYRDACHSLGPLQACVANLKERGCETDSCFKVDRCPLSKVIGGFGIGWDSSEARPARFAP